MSGPKDVYRAQAARSGPQTWRVWLESNPDFVGVGRSLETAEKHLRRQMQRYHSQAWEVALITQVQGGHRWKG